MYDLGQIKGQNQFADEKRDKKVASDMNKAFQQKWMEQDKQAAIKRAQMVSMAADNNAAARKKIEDRQAAMEKEKIVDD